MDSHSHEEKPETVDPSEEPSSSQASVDPSEEPSSVDPSEEPGGAYERPPGIEPTKPWQQPWDTDTKK